MALKIWTSPLSYNCLRPNLVLAEKDITDYEEVPADLITGKHKVRPPKAPLSVLKTDLRISNRLLNSWKSPYSVESRCWRTVVSLCSSLGPSLDIWR